MLLWNHKSDRGATMHRYTSVAPNRCSAGSSGTGPLTGSKQTSLIFDASHHFDSSCRRENERALSRGTCATLIVNGLWGGGIPLTALVLSSMRTPCKGMGLSSITHATRTRIGPCQRLNVGSLHRKRVPLSNVRGASRHASVRHSGAPLPAYYPMHRSRKALIFPKGTQAGVKPSNIYM